MKNIFIDLGTHFGQGLSHFIRLFKIDSSWMVFSFEANPIVFNAFIKKDIFLKNIIFYNKAAFTYDGSIVINVETPPNEGETGMGSSVIDLKEWNPWNGKLRESFKTNYSVECIDFSNFIKMLHNTDTNIFVKMDIEGSEFCILEKMIEEKTIFLIKEIWIEFHDSFFVDKESYIKRKENIILFLNENKIKYNEWH